ncbi:DUF6585 family protein, partial [Embleya sp. NPDC059213]|uniref:DUF6585 family protein n=1 Tax=Embleya sp. NPDC059213 TaxID=3346771 RepID=UPI0036BD454A
MLDHDRYDGTVFTREVVRTDGVRLKAAGVYRDPRQGGSPNTPVEPVQRYAALGPLIDEHVARALLPAARATLGAGKTLAFGRITISAAGVHGKQGVVPWARISHAEGRLRDHPALRGNPTRGHPGGRLDPEPVPVPDAGRRLPARCRARAEVTATVGRSEVALWSSAFAASPAAGRNCPRRRRRSPASPSWSTVHPRQGCHRSQAQQSQSG